MAEIPADLEVELMLLGRHLLQLQKRATYRGIVQLDRSAYVLLARLDAEGPMSIRQLRDGLSLDDSTINRQTAAVLRAGFVTRIEPDGVSSARRFELTDAGRRKLRNERRAWRLELSRVTKGWNKKRFERLFVTIRALNMTFEDYDGYPWPRPGQEIV